jgi:hypothetical protein
MSTAVQTPLASPAFRTGRELFTAYVVVTVVTSVANATAAIADFARAKQVLANAAELRISPSWLPLLGALKAAGAVGLLLGLFGVRLLGLAAATGLVLFFLGALAAHLRARVYHNLAVPGGYLALAVASLVLAAAQRTTNVEAGTAPPSPGAPALRTARAGAAATAGGGPGGGRLEPRPRRLGHTKRA